MRGSSVGAVWYYVMRAIGGGSGAPSALRRCKTQGTDSSRAEQGGMRVTIVEVTGEGAEDVTSLWCNDRGSLAKGKPPPLPLPFGEVIRSHTRANASLHRKGVAADVPLCYI
jgi:hypothetical protein